jgi:KAP family P-loop domain
LPTPWLQRTTAEVFEAINLFLSDTTDLEAKFVIGLDPAVIAAHLDGIYKQLDNVQFIQHGDDPSPGWAFLRKVVQLPVSAPHVTDSAAEQFVEAALDIPTSAAHHFTDTISAEVLTIAGNKNAKPDKSTTEALSSIHASATPQTAIATPQTTILRTGSLEHQPEIVNLMTQRLINQPGRSAREAKRMLNVWQLYQRVLDLSNPMRDEEEVIQRACHLMILAEIITRWPALQRQLHRSINRQRGLQILAAACHDDEEWATALTDVGLNKKEHNKAVANIRGLLREYDGLAVADLAAKVL